MFFGAHLSAVRIVKSDLYKNLTKIIIDTIVSIKGKFTK